MSSPPQFPTLTLNITAHTPTSVRRHIRSLLTARCGPCHVVFGPNDGTRVTYHLQGPWPISASQIHTHLVAVIMLAAARRFPATTSDDRFLRSHPSGLRSTRP